MRIIGFLPCLLMWALINGCSKPGCLGAGGTMVRVARPAGAFTDVAVYDNLHLVLVQGASYSIEVEALSGIEPNIGIDLANGLLTLRNETNCRWLRDPEEAPTVYLTLPRLRRLAYNTSGSVRSGNTLLTDSLMVFSDEGAGDIHLDLKAGFTEIDLKNENADLLLTGSSAVCHAYSNPRGTLDLRNFEVRRMVIGYAGVRDAFVFATEHLEATLFHSGNLYYRGRPNIAANNAYGSGRLIALP